MLKETAVVRHVLDPTYDPFDVMFAEEEDDEYRLNAHLDQRLANDRGEEECPKWDEEVAARNTREIEQGIRNAGTEKNAEEANTFDQTVDRVAHGFEDRQVS